MFLLLIPLRLFIYRDQRHKMSLIGKCPPSENYQFAHIQRRGTGGSGPLLLEKKIQFNKFTILWIKGLGSHPAPTTPTPTKNNVPGKNTDQLFPIFCQYLCDMTQRWTILDPHMPQTFLKVKTISKNLLLPAHV